ncbi:MAG: hypothetical protein ACI87W_003445 [Halieaceae bacterium]
MVNEHLSGWIFGAAIAQGAFLVFALATIKAGNSPARWLLTAILLLLTLTLGEEFLDPVNYPIGLGMGMATEFLLWPLLYLFIGALAEDDSRPLGAQWRHLLPAGLAIAGYLLIYLGAEDRWSSLSNPQTRQQIALTVLIKALYFSAYAWMILRRPLALASKPPQTRRALIWVRSWICLVCGAYLLTLLSFLTFYLELDWAIDSDYIGGLLMVLSIYSLGYFALSNHKVLNRHQ